MRAVAVAVQHVILQDSIEACTHLLQAVSCCNGCSCQHHSQPSTALAMQMLQMLTVVVLDAFSITVR